MANKGRSHNDPETWTWRMTKKPTMIRLKAILRQYHNLPKRPLKISEGCLHLGAYGRTKRSTAANRLPVGAYVDVLETCL